MEGFCRAETRRCFSRVEMRRSSILILIVFVWGMMIGWAASAVVWGDLVKKANDQMKEAIRVVDSLVTACPLLESPDPSKAI